MYSFVNLWELSNHTLFDNIALPDGIDKNVMVNSIFDECGEFQPLTIDVTLMKMMIDNFFLKYFDNFRRLQHYRTLDYNPIHNYDRTSTNTTSESGSDKYSRDTNIQDSTDSTVSDDTENFTSSYDSYEYQKSGKDTSDTSSSVSNSHTDDIDDTTTYGKVTTITDRTYGNIGVTTSTQMLEQDTEYWKKNNMYNTIAQLFMSEMCICVVD